MEKILVVIDAHKPDMDLVDFACDIAHIAHTKLTGLFIDNIYSDYIPTGMLDLPPYLGTEPGQVEVTPATSANGEAVQLFKEECLRKGISEFFYVDKGEPIQQVVYESRYADLLIVDPEISFYEEQGRSPSHFVKEVLAKAECPVLLASGQIQDIEEIVFCYDGSASSIFAIRQFTYLFPDFKNRKVILLEVNKSGSIEFDESHRRMMDWLRSHYPTVQYNCLEGDVKDRLFTYFFMKRKKMIVMGAYGRSLLSNFFKRSSLDVLVRMVDLPVFITHH